MRSLNQENERILRTNIRERGCVILRQLDTCSASTASYSPVSALPSLDDWSNASGRIQEYGPMYVCYPSQN